MFKRDFVHRLTKVLFVFSDVIAWVLVFVTVLAAVASPFTNPVHAQMSQNEFSLGLMVLEIITLLVVAYGAYSLTRRKVSGLLLVLSPSIIWLFTSHIGFAVAYGLSVLVVFGLPLSLSYIELQRNVSEQQKT